MNGTEKLLDAKLQAIFPGYRDGAYITEDHELRYSAQLVSIAGRQVLRAFMSVSVLQIERLWMQYKPELMIEQLFNPVTVVLSARDYDTSLSVEDNEMDVSALNELEFLALTEDLFAGHFAGLIGKYKSIENCDLLLNRSVEIDDTNSGYSDIQSLPFRKVLLAQATGNPKRKEIEAAMRNYCAEQFELGKAEDFEQLCRLKPVFEKLFGH